MNQSWFLERGCDEALFSGKKGFSVKRGEAIQWMRGLARIVQERLNCSVKRSGPFSEPPDSENWKVVVLIPFPKISSEWIDARPSKNQTKRWPSRAGSRNWCTFREGPARHLGQKLSPHCLETLFDSQLPSPKLSPKMPPKLSLPHKSLEGIFPLAKWPLGWG